MGKQGKLAESRYKEWHQRPPVNPPLPSRSSGFTRVRFDSSVTKNPNYELKKPERQPEQPQHFNTIRIPEMMMTSPFLQHPSLTPGQKHYLYTVAEAYSEDHVRKLICQHYLNVLHRSIRTGVSHAKDMTLSIDPLLRTHSPDVESSPEQQKKSSNGQKPKASSKKRLVLPKINSHRKRFPPESNARKSKPPMRKRYHASGLVHWKAEEDSVLSEISSLSLESEDVQDSVQHHHVNTYS
ncbi:protein FAM216A isoform X2 [Colossoma macropomum]|uniref:protein FAM216A isoform X2 n=1 Tax=Colossoma macropomum TaxID=42526 RepID=UPI001865670A|nr:protein FAM216A isoform X2 [Colossoma macropomum]